MEKRHIGSIARVGLLNNNNMNSLNNYNDYEQRQDMDKRHIGALARSGWLPSFRPVRGGRFSRSGRARSRTVGS